QFIGILIGLTILLGFLARAIAYGLFRIYYYYKNERSQGMRITTIKSFWDMNQGINEFTTYSYLLTVIISSLFFAIGVVAIIQFKLFRSDSLLSFIGAYLIVKVGVYVYIWVKYG
ncbi:MAG: hypothetical protein ACXACX_18485, partial [Candidatus Hodarchaeales archaeon]